MKYIIVTNEYGIEVAVVFSELLSHDTVAKSFDKVISAGFCNPTNEEREIGFNTYRVWEIWGKSVSLNLHSRLEDERILTHSLGMRV